MLAASLVGYAPRRMNLCWRSGDGRAGHRLAEIALQLAVATALLLAIAGPSWAVDEVGPGTRYDIVDDPLFDDPPGVDRGEAGDADAFFDDDFDLEFDDTPMGFPDPWEKLNRGTLVVNRVIDRFVMDPLTVGYRFILPEQLRRAIERVFDNINSTQTFANDVFQLEWNDAGITLSRMIVNSTAGIGGLFDPASRWGMPGHISDFGQTLAISGAPSGPYFMIPLLGPSNVRDGIGLGVDSFLHPTFFLLAGLDVLFFSGSEGLTERARYFEEIKALEESSIDYYAALRSGYYQNRQSQIWSRREDRRPPPEHAYLDTAAR
jgi:phospholipid-binding lipoprotein MlaA